jgi:hypothetical protein
MKHVFYKCALESYFRSGRLHFAEKVKKIMFPTVPYLQHFFDAIINGYPCRGLTKATYIVSI